MPHFQVVLNCELKIEHICYNIMAQIYTNIQKWTFEVTTFQQLWYFALSYKNIFVY
jgi:hypothetical protein